MRYIGRYRLDAVQGVGAFATVWRGWDEELHVAVAVKVLADNWAHHHDVRERFLEEARILRRIVDPRVVRVHDVGVHEDRPYFVMDFIPDGTIDDRVGTLDLSAAIDISEQAARAVQVLHEHDVLHRDIKPSNFLMHGDRVLVSDLGSAKRLAEASAITVTTGTPAYMAPEQALGSPLDVRTDVYALGVMAYELIAGRPPFSNIVHRKGNERPPASGAPAPVEKVLTSALATKPDERPRSAAEFADALHRAATPIVPRTVPLGWAAAMMLAAFVAAFLGVWSVRA